jgi:hypothetical protein
MATGKETVMAIKGSCHCGATQFEVDAAPGKVIRCTCSFCAKRGVLWGYYQPAHFRLKTARDRVSTYQWRTYTAQHHHCAVCGCGTYSDLIAWINGKPDFSQPKIGINARLLDDFDLDAVPVEVLDGKNLW